MLNIGFATDGLGSEGKKYEDVVGEKYETRISQITNRLYLGITEAMTNSIQHAYIAQRADKLNVSEEKPGYWWMFSQEKDGWLTIVFCDLGVGIPNTLPLKDPNLWQRLCELLGRNPNDAEAVEEATKPQTSRTLQKHRGKGLRQICEIVESNDGATLIIHSNRGCYTLAKSGGRNTEFSDSILGTLISWRLPLITQ